MSVVCVRIGNLTKDHPPREYERGQAMWLSHRDCGHLFDRCLQADYGYGSSTASRTTTGAITRSNAPARSSATTRPTTPPTTRLKGSRKMRQAKTTTRPQTAAKNRFDDPPAEPNFPSDPDTPTDGA